MKPLILIMAMVCAMASCSKKPQSASLAPVSTLDTICADTLHTSTDSLPATSSTAATSAATSTSSFNGVCSRNSYGADEILGFDDDVDDDNDMDAFMNDYRDDF